MKILPDCFFCTLNDPCHDKWRGIFHEIVRIVLLIAAARNFRIERDDNQTSPDAGVHCTDFRKVVSIQHQRMARCEGKRVFIFLLRKNLIRGAELFDDGSVQAHSFFQFGGDNQPLTLRLGKLRLHVPLAAHRQCISGHIAAVGTKHTGNGVPEGGLSVPLPRTVLPPAPQNGT